MRAHQFLCISCFFDRSSREGPSADERDACIQRLLQIEFYVQNQASIAFGRKDHCCKQLQLQEASPANYCNASRISTALMASAAELVIPPVYPAPSPMGYRFLVLTDS